MEYQLGKEAYQVCETVFEGTAEQPVDLDLTLPDYCPDIEKILKCRIIPRVTGKNISGDRLDVDGSALISLYYLDSGKKAVRVCEHTVPYSAGFTIKGGCDDPAAVVRLKTDYLNCRAVSPRRADIHGAFSVSVCVYGKDQQEYCCDIEGDDIQQKKHTEKLSRLSGIAQQQFSITEVLDIGQGKGMPESIIRDELYLKTESCKALDDKLMITGEAVLRILYVTDIDSGSLDTMTFHVPFTQVLDVTGIKADTENKIILEVMNYDTMLKSEYDENSTLVTLDAKICAVVLAFEQTETTLVDDAYSTKYELDLDQKAARLTGFVPMEDEVFSVKEELNTGDNVITQIVDLWCDGVNNINSYEDSVLNIKGKLNCCILALDGDGVPFYIERPVEFSHSVPMEQEQREMNVRMSVSPEGLSFRITGDNTIEVRADMRLSGTLFTSKTIRAVTGAESSEDRIRTKDKTAALTVYYADKGESLWNIARMYCTSPEALRLENDMNEDIVASRQMILIPM